MLNTARILRYLINEWIFSNPVDATIIVLSVTRNVTKSYMITNLISCSSSVNVLTFMIRILKGQQCAVIQQYPYVNVERCTHFLKGT